MAQTGEKGADGNPLRSPIAFYGLCRAGAGLKQEGGCAKTIGGKSAGTTAFFAGSQQGGRRREWTKNGTN
jgi:hypothetical protein